MTHRRPSDPIPHRRLVLASTSTFRQLQLQQLRLPFDSIDPDVDETPVQQLGLPPERLVATLAVRKAQAAVGRAPDAIIIGADQCAAIDDQILGKPGTFDNTVDQLSRLAGRTHRLVTALCVLDARSGHHEVHVDEHLLTMRALTHAQVRRYVELDRPFDCAGSYKIEALGIALFERTRGDDPSAIVGLPLMRLVTMLNAMGFDTIAAAS